MMDIQANTDFPNSPKGFSFENSRRNISLLNDSVSFLMLHQLFLERCEVFIWI